MAIVIDELVQGLSACLQQNTADRVTRQAWLTALLEAELTDIEIGGIDLAPSAREAVLAHATEQEWDWIAARIRTEIPKNRDWARSVLVEFLTQGLERRGRDGDSDALIRELGTPEQQAHLLISEGKVDEAMERIKRIIVGKPGLVTEFAAVLLQAGAQTEAVTLVLENSRNHWMSRDWLAKYYRQYGGTPQEAVEAQQRVFLDWLSVEAFKTLHQVSRKADNWEQVARRCAPCPARSGEFWCLD